MAARSSGPEKSSRKERSRSREKTRRRSRGAARPRERGDRERERGQRERSQRERSQRERSRRERSRPPQEPPARRPKVEVAACGLYELVMEVLRRWREASEDDVSDERFENAINVAADLYFVETRKGPDVDEAAAVDP
ncbi:unnamed protein product [Effrenium voratum]|nr:unnamed protein product [Effrenium voratum]